MVERGQEFKYVYEKKIVADSIRVMEEKKVVTAQFKQEETKRYALYVMLVLTIVFGRFMFNRFRLSQKQKNIIQEQKVLVEEKQREILDSIYYARRIQNSLLPQPIKEMAMNGYNSKRSGEILLLLK